MQTTQIVETHKRNIPGPRLEPAAVRSPGETRKRIESPQAKQAAREQRLIEFEFESPQAGSVGVAGTFNDWNAERAPLRKEGTKWKARLPLAPGRHEYRFVVDGQWLSDPRAKEAANNPYGSDNSVIRVEQG